MDSAALRRAGYRVLEASGGKQAVHLVRNNGDLDLVLLDVTHGRYGRPRGVRADSGCVSPGLSVVIISGHSLEEALVTAGGEATEFLQKPFTPRRLLAFVDRTLLQCDRDRLCSGPQAPAGLELAERRSLFFSQLPRCLSQLSREGCAGSGVPYVGGYLIRSQRVLAIV